jgi:hypothetical protein
VAHKILVIAYHVIRDRVEYRDAGGDYFDRRDPARTAKRLAQRLERLGFDVVPKTTQAVQRRTSTRPPISLEQAGGCARCARWGVPCIHARNAKAHPRQDVSHSDHSG